MNPQPPHHDIVLIGAGHTHAHLLRAWHRRPLERARLSCISDFPVATYSGMLPGTLAGLYRPEQMQIDLAALCAAAGARFVCGEVSAVDRTAMQVYFADGSVLPYGWLSIGIGSVPWLPPSAAAEPMVVTIKPMQTFLERLDRRLEALAEVSLGRPWRIAVVGAGAAGVEITFCLPPRLALRAPGCRYELTLVDRAPQILSEGNTRLVRLVRGELESRGVELALGRAVADARDGRLHFERGAPREFDLVVWATGAVAPPLLERLGLPTDEKGFLLARPTLASVGDARVFVVGDSGTDVARPAPKAGVYAVRQGPVLWDNLERALEGRPLRPYVPQRGFLRLLASGDRRAFLAYKGWSFHARWCWWLKDTIDTRFVDRYRI